MHKYLRHRVLGWWAGLICDHPRLVLAIALVGAAASVWVTSQFLHFQPDRNALISPNLDWNQRYLQYRRNFSFDDIVVAIAVPRGFEGRLQARAYADELAARLSAETDHVYHVYWRIDTLAASAAAVRILPWNEFDEAMVQMADSAVVLRAENLGQMLATIPAQLSQSGPKLTPQQAAQRINQVHQLVEAAAAAIGDEPPDAIREHLDHSAGGRYQYLASGDERLLFMLVEPMLSEEGLEPVQPAVDVARRLMAELSPAFPTIEAGLTGVPVIEADETRVTQRDSALASALAVILIALILLADFRSVRLPAMIVATLLIAMAWSFGVLTLTIGHLQLLSITFTVMLLGLGVAFGIYLVTRFELVRRQYPAGPEGFRHAMVDTIQTMGPGIATGAVTTAAAFATTLLTDFTGMAEMGFIAGVGILLCLVAMFSVLPAMMRLARPSPRPGARPPSQRTFNFYNHQWWTPFYRRPAITIAVVALVALSSLLGARHLRYDYNLANLLPRGVDSVQWFDRILHSQQVPTDNSEQFEQSIWFGASAIDVRRFPDPAAALAEARQRTYDFQQLPSVAGVGGVGLLFPPDEQRKLARIVEVREKLGDALQTGHPLRPSEPVIFNGQLQALGLAVQIATLRDEVKAEPIIAEALSTLAHRIGEVSSQLSRMHPDQARERLAVLNEQFGHWREDVRRRIDEALVHRPLDISDLPGPARRRAVGGPQDNVLLLQVYPRGNVYDPAQIQPFVQQMRSVDPDVTGTVIQIYESTELMLRSYAYAGLYAIIAVFVLILLDFQKPIDAVLCLLPVVMAFLVLLGIMGANRLPLNPANIIVLPLLFGIGVDCGVHMMHRYRQHPEERPPGLAEGTGKGITLTSITTIVGFACLMIASHRGIASLGFTLAMGMALTLLVCLTVMPSLLEIRSAVRSKRLARQNGAVLQK